MSDREGGQSSSAAVPRWKRHFHALIAAEVSALTRYFDRVVQAGRLPHDSGFVLDRVECGEKALAESDLPDLTQEETQRTAVLLNGTLNYSFDIQHLLAGIRQRLSRNSRIVAVLYNPYFAGLYRLARRMGLKAGEVPSTFLTHADVRSIAKLAGYELVRSTPAVYIPWRLLGIGDLVNRILPAVPLLRHFGLVSILVLRPLIPSRPERPSLSIVIPARNERGNIENAIRRIPDLGCRLEILFVEGHSSDGTWEEIQRVVGGYEGPWSLRAFQQTGRGKNDAVRLGFEAASGELLTILDADLTMPPEDLVKFYEAWCEGLGDFVNGTRLVYPMEGEAMRFLNRLGNVFFAKALSAVLGARLGDSLCGTKLLARHDYDRIVRWRRDFGDFDPFGDFELLFPAAILSLGIIDIPVRYRARTYGTTNISRFRHGLMLLKMTAVGLLRVRTGKVPGARPQRGF
jgi:hypothetical protein